jgi:hypothetical protein
MNNLLFLCLCPDHDLCPFLHVANLLKHIKATLCMC